MVHLNGNRSKVESLVRRLSAILTSAEQDRILSILKERRARLVALLGLREQDDAEAR
jgi:hypothetical protein